MAVDVDSDATIVTFCPSCAARARARQHPKLKGTTVTSVVVNGPEGERWTVMVRRGHNLIATSQAETEQDALVDALLKIGVVLE